MEIFEIWQIGFVVCMKWILVVDLIGLKSKLDVNLVHCRELEACEIDWFCFKNWTKLALKELEEGDRETHPRFRTQRKLGASTSRENFWNS